MWRHHQIVSTLLRSLMMFKWNISGSKFTCTLLRPFRRCSDLQQFECILLLTSCHVSPVSPVELHIRQSFSWWGQCVHNIPCELQIAWNTQLIPVFFFFDSLLCMNSILETSKRVTSLIIRRQFLKEKQRSQNSLFKFLGELRGCNEAQANIRGSKHYSCINVLRFKILVCLFGMRCNIWTVMRESETFKAFWNQGMKGRYLGTDETS